MSSREEIPTGWIVHTSSGKPVHPEGGSSNPHSGTHAVIYHTGLGESRLKFQFEPVDGEGHFGYIKHVPSGLYIHPYGGHPEPGNNTNLLYYSGKHSACLMCFDEINSRIIQKGSNRIWHPKGGSSNPGNDTLVRLHSDRHDGARFHMVDSKGNRISPYPTPNLAGKWVLVFGIENAESDKVFEKIVAIGEERTETTTINNAWSMSAKVAKGLFSADATYSGYVEESSSVTWSKYITTSLKIEVKKGDTFGTWQFEFDLEQYGDAYVYHSDYYKDTDHPTHPPPV